MRSELINKFEEAFDRASEKRTSLNHWIGNVPAWVVHERKCMVEAVNEHRIALGKNPVDMETFIRKAENPAVGHSDYAHKFALYCAFLVEAD
jgi:hypothetical protein